MGVGGQRHAPAAFTPGKDGWAPELVWTGAENLAPNGIRSPDRPARSESLYQLSYPGRPIRTVTQHSTQSAMHYTGTTQHKQSEQ